MTAARTEGLTKNFVAEATINPYRIVRFGTNDNAVLQAAAATDSILGVAKVPQGQYSRAIQTGALPPALPVVTIASGFQVDVVLGGIAEVEYGGTVARGDLLTTDANGKAIKAVPAAGSNNRTLGLATISGVAGDIGCVLISPGSIQG